MLLKEPQSFWHAIHENEERNFNTKKKKWRRSEKKTWQQHQKQWENSEMCFQHQYDYTERENNKKNQQQQSPEHDVSFSHSFRAGKL